MMVLDIADQVDFKFRRRLPEQLALHAIVAIAAALGVVVEIGEIAVLALIDARNTRGHIAGDRKIDGVFGADLPPLAEAEIAIEAVRVELGAVGDDVDHAGGGVLAEQRSLRALQNLDIVDIREGVEADIAGQSLHHVVDHDADRLFEIIVEALGAEAADEEARAELRVVRQARDRILQFLRGFEAELGHFIAGQ